MSERWVCKRCFADNDETDSACRQCSLIRGAEAIPADQGTWAGQAGSVTTRQPGWRRSLRYWWIPALAIFLVVGYLASARRDDGGAITSGGSLSVEDLRIGDCFNSEDAEEFSTVEARPCSESHGYELFHAAVWTESTGYPTEESMIGFVIDECMPAFESYVGRTYEVSTLDLVPFYPTEGGWGGGDRVIQCALYDPASPELTASLRNADR